MRGVILVTGGSFQTDELAVNDDGSSKSFESVSYYRCSSVGAMLANSLQTKLNSRLASFQNYYEEIHQDISKRLSFQWSNETTPRSKSAEMICILPTWVNSGFLYTDENFSNDASYSADAAIGLARLHFPKAADLIAPYYKSMASKASSLHVHTDRFVAKYNIGGPKRNIDDSIALFRVITSCIAISIIKKVSGPGFHDVQHATKLNILQADNLTILCQEVDNLAYSGLSISRCSRLVGYIHCALDVSCTTSRTNEEHDTDSSKMTLDADEGDETDFCIIGWRNGIHCVLPKLLLSLPAGPTSSNLGFCCLDEFVGNLPVQKDGSIRSRKQRTFDAIPNDLLDALKDQETSNDGEYQVIQATSAPPDVSLHLSIERPIGIDVSLLGICGRIGGEVVTNFGVYPILCTIIKAQESEEAHRKICPGQTKPEVTNSLQSLTSIATSLYDKLRFRSDGGTNSRTSSTTEKDAAWALLRAGTLGEVSTACPECTVQGPDSRKG